MNNKNFSSLELESYLLDNIYSLGYEEMTPIQASSLPSIINNKDVLAQAHTGTGKTAAFALGLLSKIDIKSKATQALVLCPTRELAEQVCKEIRKLGRRSANLRVQTLCGGAPKAPQVAMLKNGVHCIVGTPGRLQEHLRKGTLNLENLKVLVFDEADRMLDMGFYDEICEISEYAPRTRQTLLFSATYPENIQKLSNQFQNNPVVIRVDSNQDSQDNQNAEKIEDIKELFFEAQNNKLDLLQNLLNYYKPQSSIIFCNTKQKCQELVHDLQERGFYAQAIHGDLDQRQRDEALVLFAHKSLSMLVATDVAARGIDISDLEAVINFEISPDPQVHVHRIGRTGRAGKKGLALSLLNSNEVAKLKILKDYRKQEITLSSLSQKISEEGVRIIPPMATLRIGSGRKNKLRPADILGALTAGAILGSEVGKIDVLDFHSFVAVSRCKIDSAFKLLSQEKIKGNFYKIQLLAS